MDDDSQQELDDRGRALERAFFRKEGEKLRAEIVAEHDEVKDALESASGLSDAALLERLASLGIRAETLAALTLIPLVEVAWADGEMDARERAAVLRGAASSGLEPGTPSYGLLDIWTRDRPAPELLDSWHSYIRSLCAGLTPEQRRHLADKILGRARAVAEAAGGFLGLVARVSPEEEAVLQELESAFAP